MAGAVGWKVLTPILLCWLLVKCEQTAPDLTWGNSCPVACSCHIGHFADLPVNQWLQKEQTANLKAQSAPPNEAYYEADSHKDESVLHKERGGLLKIAMCIFQSKADPDMLLQQLPKDTQALTLLQSRGSEEITLEAEHMRRFEEIIFLDIQGYCPEAWREDSHDQMMEHNFMLSNDILKPIPSLQYLSMQHIKILGSSIMSNEIDHAGNSMPPMEPHQNEIAINLQSERSRKFRRPFRTQSPNLIFLTPNGAEKELVPYKIYVEQQERARLSVFARLMNLILLRIVDCGLHEVYWEMFEGLNKLEYLALEKNQLLFLPEFAFYGTPHLKTLSLAHNKLLNIQSTGLAGLLELQKLDLSDNKFSYLSEFSLPPFPKLETAYFWHNPIETVFASTFEIMNATTTLYLGGNDSSLTLHPNSFQGLNCLKKLVLFNIGVDILERPLLSGMPQLKYLKMSGTITTISFDAFLDSPMLETLDLQHSNIKSVSMDAFYGLYRLLVLDLSNNLLESLPPGIFDQQFSLKELYLQNNSLTELPDGFFTSISAKIVRLDGNLWHCTCNMKGWLAAATNKIKIIKSTLCEHDKGIGCPSPHSVSYVYEKKVAPKCTTPTKYNGWSVYHVLRRELRCTKPMSKKFNRKEYLKKKHKEYENTNMQFYKHNVHNNTSVGEMKNSFERFQNKNAKRILEFSSKKIQNTPISSTLPNLESNNATEFTQSTQPAQSSNTTRDIQTTENSQPLLVNVNITNAKHFNNDVLENTLPIIPSLKHNQYDSLPQMDTQMHNELKTEQAVSVPIHSHSLEAAHTKTMHARGTHEKFKNTKLEVKSMVEDSKSLKKLWKNELQRKHQEKIKKYQALS